MHVKTKMFTHQKEAYEKGRLKEKFALFMEMGTGKTRVMFELIKEREKKISNVVIFCPVSTMQNLYNEVKKHTDIESIYVLDGSKKKEFLTIVGYQSIAGSDRFYFEALRLITENTFVILDESHRIKNVGAKTTMLLIDMCKQCKYKLIMTGTPITKWASDLFSQFKFLDWRILGYRSFFSFENEYIEYSNKFPGLITGIKNEIDIQRKIDNYCFNVKKEECLDLPEKTYQTRYFHLSNLEYYCRKKDEMLENLFSIDDKNTERRKYIIFQMFTALHKISAMDKNRIYCLVDLLTDLNNRCIIIWCEYVKQIEIIKKKTKCFSISGENSMKERIQTIENFENQGGILCLTSGCGSEGLNLQFADCEIFFSNSFDFAKRSQAEDRIHRIGQKNKCTYIDMCANQTIDEYVLQNLYSKKSAIDQFEKYFLEDKENVKKILG